MKLDDQPELRLDLLRGSEQILSSVYAQRGTGGQSERNLEGRGRQLY